MTMINFINALPGANESVCTSEYTDIKRRFGDPVEVQNVPKRKMIQSSKIIFAFCGHFASATCPKRSQTTKCPHTPSHSHLNSLVQSGHSMSGGGGGGGRVVVVQQA